MKTYTVRAHSARKVKDPVLGDQGVERHTFVVPVREYPRDLPLDPNARVPNINRRVYRDVEASLLNENGEPGTFHLKHKGVVIVAEAVEKRDEDEFAFVLGEGHGILDGGHTDALINKHAQEDLPDNQFIELRVLTKIPDKLIPELSQGLNTSMQVQPFSLDNLEGLFDKIKKRIKDKPYYSSIAWRENEPGDYDARDLVSFLLCFNTDLYPNDQDAQPVISYEKKSEALKLFEENKESFDKLLPILPDILQLHDIIQFQSRKHWNERGGQFGNLAFVEGRKRGEFTAPFTGETGRYRLMNGALYPMFASFRWMVEKDPKSGDAKWRGGFDAVIDRWNDSAAELMRMTATASAELGRNPNAIGKSRNHWANLHARVAMRDLMKKTGVSV